MERQLLQGLERDGLLAERVQRLMSIPGVGPVTAITWALEIGGVERFRGAKQAVGYYGLCGAEDSSAGKQKQTPLSKQRSHHLQSVLIEGLAAIYEREKKKGNCNRATLAVARKLMAYLLAVDRRQTEFLPVVAALA